MTPSEMSTMRAPSVMNTEVDRNIDGSIALTSAIEIPDIADSVRDTDTLTNGENNRLGIADRIKEWLILA